MSREWLERELEDYTKNNLKSLVDAMMVSGDGFKLIGTQIPCVLGRIDMLCSRGSNLYVIEFKAIKASERELGQVLRYCSLLQELIDPYKHITSNADFHEIARTSSFRVQPVLVAPRFEDVLFVSGCALIIAEKNGTNDFSFRSASAPFRYADIERQNKDVQALLAPFEKDVIRIAADRIGKV